MENLDIDPGAAILLNIKSSTKKREYQVKVTLNDAELNFLNYLVGKQNSDKASVLRGLLRDCAFAEGQTKGPAAYNENNTLSNGNESKCIDQPTCNILIEDLRVYKKLFDEELISENEYEILRKKALHLE